MSDTIRSVALDQRDRHAECECDICADIGPHCKGCDKRWPCADRVAADKYLAILDAAEREQDLTKWWSTGEPSDIADTAFRLIQDPVGAQPETEPA